MTEIPLFPLNVVLMPGTPMPLHIFEERYKQMVNECLEDLSEFGMVLADEGGGTRNVGCTARIVELMQRYEDGRLVILVEGSRRFKLNNILTGKPYYMGEVEYLEDEMPDEDVSALAEECIVLLKRVIEAAMDGGDVGIEIEPPYNNLSFAIAGRIESDLETRQRILEIPSEEGRLRRVRELLAETAEKLERDKSIREKAETNGHVRGDWKPKEEEGN